MLLDFTIGFKKNCHIKGWNGHKPHFVEYSHKASSPLSLDLILTKGSLQNVPKGRIPLKRQSRLHIPEIHNRLEHLNVTIFEKFSKNPSCEFFYAILPKSIHAFSVTTSIHFFIISGSKYALNFVKYEIWKWNNGLNFKH